MAHFIEKSSITSGSNFYFQKPLTKKCVFVLPNFFSLTEKQRILKDNEPLPAGLVKPKPGKLIWILDQDAASLYTAA